MRRLPPEIKTVCVLSPQQLDVFRQKIASAPTKSEKDRLTALLATQIRPELVSWAKYFFPHYLPKPLSQLHKWLVQELQAAHVRRGKYTAIVAPRLGAKTTWTSKIYTLYCVCEELERYQLLVSDTLKLSKKNLSSIRDELVGNQKLAEFYPLACGKGPRWNTTELETRHGFFIEAIGADTATRGSTFKNYRPSRIVIDDLMRDKQARSQNQRDYLTEWFLNALLPMGDRDTNVIFVGTALHRDDTLQRLKTAPGWQFETFKSIIKEASNQALWDEWKKLFRNPLDKHRADTARAFYKQHEAEMLAGADVLWPEYESLYDLMVYRNTKGEHSFQSEKQGNPTAASKAEWPDDYFPANIWFDKFPALTLKVIALDPSKGKTDTSDFSAFVMMGLGADGLLYVDANLERRDTTRIVEDGFDIAAEFKPDAFAIETNQFQELLQVEFERQARERGILLPLVNVNNLTKKEIRIRTLGPYIRNGRFRFRANSEGAKLLVDQLREFPYASHDDGPDALEMAIKAMQYLIGGQSQQVDGEQWSA